MSGIPLLIHEICYVPCSQAKVGGIVGQFSSILYKRYVFASLTQNLSMQMASRDVKETYSVCRSTPKSNKSVVREVFNQNR